MGWGLGDLVDAASDAWDEVKEVAEDVKDTVEDTVEDVYEGVKDVASEVKETVGDVGGNVFGLGSRLGDRFGSAFESLADKASDLGGAVLDKAGDAGNAFLNTLDDTVLDSVDYVTNGVVNLDYEDGNVTADVGIDGIANLGFKAGENGFSVDAEGIGFDASVAYDSDTGFAAHGSAGIDWGPLPYAEGHLEVSPNGDISINGEIQGTLPTPWGVVSGNAEGGFVRTDEGWGAYVEADGSLRLPSGTTISGGGGIRYAEDAEGNSQFGVDAHGSVSAPGMGTIGGSAGYTRIEEDGVVVEQATAEGHASGFGMSAEAGVEHTRVTAGGETISHTETHADIDGLDAESIAQLGAALTGADASDIAAGIGAAGDILAGATGAMAGAADTVADTMGGAAETMAAASEAMHDTSAAMTQNLAGTEAGMQATMDEMSSMQGGSYAPAEFDVVEPAYVEQPQYEAPAAPEPTQLDQDLAQADQTASSMDSMWEGVGDGMG